MDEPLNTTDIVLEGETPTIDLLEEDYNLCKDLANSNNILLKVAQTITGMGLVNENRGACLVYLTITSRLLDHPVSLVIKGPSSGGKSNLVEKVLRLFPNRAYYALSAMSEHALIYDEEDLSHRILILYEAAGIKGEFADLCLRTLLSEGELKYKTVVKTKQGLEAILIHRQGPTGLITTTTKTSLHPENETRYLSLTVNDTTEQTQNIFTSLATDRAPIDMTPWHALQDWLAGNKDREVVIPYGILLAANTRPVATRLRRDLGTVLNLIRTHAILHRATREVDNKGRIIANIESDYFNVHLLVDRLLSEMTDQIVDTRIHQTVDAVASLKAHYGEEVTVEQIAVYLSIDKRTVQRRVRVALSQGYLKNKRPYGANGRYLLDIAQPMPNNAPVLPHPIDLADAFKKQGGY